MFVKVVFVKVMFVKVVFVKVGFSHLLGVSLNRYPLISAPSGMTEESWKRALSRICIWNRPSSRVGSFWATAPRTRTRTRTRAGARIRVWVWERLQACDPEYSLILEHRANTYRHYAV